MYGDEAVSDSTGRSWFAKFRSRDITLTDASHRGRKVDFDDETLQALLKTDPPQTRQELAAQLDCSHVTMKHHLHVLGKVYKYGSWVPHELSAKNKVQQEDHTLPR